jgi:hypothetical protein
MKKPKALIFAILFTIILGAAVFGGVYALGVYRGGSDARAVIDADSTPQWHVIGEATAARVSSPPKQSMGVVVHDSTWSIYRRGFVNGYNKEAILWAQDGKNR